MSTETTTARHETHTATHDVPSVTSRPPRVDLFGPIHKAIRFALADMLARMGGTSFAEGPEGGALLAELEQLLAFCEKHAHLEDALLRPALRGHSTSVFDEGHARQGRLLAEVRALAAAIVATPAQRPDRRELAGRTLYLHFGRAVADNLAHMAEEEQVLRPLLERLLGDEELRALQARITASLSDADRLESACWMLRSASRPERAALVRSFLSLAPRPAVLAILYQVRPHLTAADWSDLARRCDLAA